MNVLERAQFIGAMAETEKMMKLAQAALQRARSHCHGEVFVQVDVMSKRAHEVKVISEWLRHAVLGRVEFPASPDGMQNRQGEDRRSGIDRRIARMQSQMLSLSPRRSAA
jgi:hypothetical protein